MSFLRHVARLWPRYALAPILPFWCWVAFLAVKGLLRSDQLALAVAATALAYGNASTKRLFLGLFPLGLVGLAYDAMRFFQHVGVSATTVHLCDLRAHELRWFGLDVEGTRGTLHDYWQLHSKPWLDVLCAIPYGVFLLVVLGYAVLLFFRDFDKQQRFTWGFLALNLTGFVTYHLYPAAPPWYFHQHGCAVFLTTAASAGPNLLRVDSMLGVHYFAGVYGRSSDVFGAVPSLHVAYPMLMLLIGWPLHRALGRTLLVLFYVWMCFSAIYLDHHWVIDAVVGSAFALIVGIVAHSVKRAPVKNVPPTVVGSRMRRTESAS